MEKYVELLDFACSECKYKGCSYNEKGVCMVDNTEFLWDRIDDFANEKGYFICYKQDIKIGHCEFCGEKLEKVVQIHDKKYGNKYEWVCPNEC